MKNAVRPSLFINGDFRAGIVVEQRNGHYIPKGGTYYTDAACTTVGGVMGGNYNVVPADDTTYKYTQNNGTILYFKAEDVVHGYAGGIYGVDMWKGVTGGTVEVDDDGIILNPERAANMGVYQRFENYLPAGVYTISAMFRDDCPAADCRADFVVTNASDTVFVDRIVTGTPGSIVSWTFTVAEGVTIRRAGVYTPTAYAPRYRALKLEPGDTQTLGHQDSSGSWVLNEVSKYVDTLAECQRYCWVVDFPVQYSGILAAGVIANAATTSRALVQPPVTMRMKPTASIVGSLQAYDIVGNKAYPITGLSVLPSGPDTDYLRLQVELSSYPTANVAMLWIQNRETLPAKIIFTADL